MENAKDNYWREMYDTINKYNDQHHKPLPNMNIREDTNQVMREERGETHNVTVNTFSPKINKNENIINEWSNLTIDDVGSDIINEVANLTINNVRNYLINKVANLIIKNFRNDSNRANTSDIQVQFAGDPSGISDQSLLSGRTVGIR